MISNVSYHAYKFRLTNNLLFIPLDYAFLKQFLQSDNYHIKTYIEASQEIENFGYSEYASSKHAFTVIEGHDYATTYIDDNLPLELKAKVLLHEYGHIYLKHTYSGVLGKSDDELETNRQEKEATDFALFVLAPPRMLKDLGITDIGHISSATLLSNDDAVQIQKEIHNLDSIPATDIESEFSSLIKRKYKKNRSIIKLNNKTLFSVLFILVLCVIMSCIIVMVVNNTGTESLPAVTYSSEVESRSAANNSNETVYITKSGDSLHLENCRHIENRNTFTMTCNEAVKAGYSPCKDCMP